MTKSKVNMSSDLKKECSKVIHTAARAAAAAGAIPIPMSDTIPITLAQIMMVIQLGKVFDVEISQSVAKSILGVNLARETGRKIVTSALKMFPGVGSAIGGAISASTAAALTETMGWIVADDFFRMSKGDKPQDLLNASKELKAAFEEVKQ